ncbi:MAG: hypothetical protein EXQ52_04475, partial [Bryobacterales bacterium]|nr:hypothetical protein [Bryobacterales bacterium]
MNRHIVSSSNAGPGRSAAIRVLNLSSIFLMLSALAVPSLRAQTTTGDILGAVTDQTGAAVAGATVTLTNQDTKVSTERTSDDSGDFAFTIVRPGMYSVTAAKPGFERVVSKDLQLLLGQRVRVGLALRVGGVAETVEVTASGVLLESQNAALGQVIGQRTIEDLPLNGRNFMQLTQLTPGVIPSATSRDSSRSWTGREDTSASISGQRLDFVSFLLDGVETRASRWGQPGIRPSVDAIQEFKVQRNTFSAEFGFSPVAVNTALKSGANAFHGTMFEFLRNERLDARNFFDLAGKSSFRQNNFGATLGGRIIRDKLFFFGNYEGLRQRLTRVQNAFYPSQDWLKGDFNSLRFADGSPAQIVDASGGNIPFPNNLIPASRQSRVAQKLTPYIPVANVAGDPRFNTTKPVTDPWDWDQYHGRFDHVISPRDTAYYRFSLAQETKFQNTIHPLGGGNFPQTNRNLAISETHTFSPSVINEARFGYNRTYLGRLPEGAFGPDIARDLGLRNITAIKESFGPPNVSMNALATFGGNQTAIYQIENMFHAADNLSWIRGKHSLKMGGEFRKFLYKQNTTGWEAPKFNFTGQFSVRPDARGALPQGAAAADFMLGHVFRGDSGDGTAFQDLHTSFLGFFAQDDYRATKNLTFNFGVRYELLPSPTDVNGRMQYFDFNAKKLRRIGEAGAITRLHPTDRNNFAPRFGFAYSPGGGRTVIRGGYGIYYTTPYWNDYHFLIWGPPYYSITSVFSDQNRPTLALDRLFDPFDVAFAWLNSND